MKCFKVPLKHSKNLFSAYRLHIKHWKCFYEVTLSLADEESGSEIHGSYTFHKCAFWHFFSYQLDGRIFICVKIYGLNFFPTVYALNATDSITFTCVHITYSAHVL